jgi:hypothetical protein
VLVGTLLLFFSNTTKTTKTTMVDNGTETLEDLRDELIENLLSQIRVVNQINHLSSNAEVASLEDKIMLLHRKQGQMLRPLTTVVRINSLSNWVEYNGEQYPIVEKDDLDGTLMGRYYDEMYVDSESPPKPKQDYMMKLYCTYHANKCGCGDEFMIPGRIISFRHKVEDGSGNTVDSDDDDCCSSCKSYRYFVKIETTCEDEVRAIHGKHFGKGKIKGQEFQLENLYTLKVQKSKFDYLNISNPVYGRFESGVGPKKAEEQFSKRQKEDIAPANE